MRFLSLCSLVIGIVLMKAYAYCPYLDGCKTCVDGKIDECKDCYSGYYLDPSSKKCSSCGLSGFKCRTCDDDRKCSTCNGEYYLKDDKTCGRCSDAFPRCFLCDKNGCKECRDEIGRASCRERVSSPV